MKHHQYIVIVMHQQQQIPILHLDQILKQVHLMMNIMPKEKFQRKKFINILKVHLNHILKKELEIGRNIVIKNIKDII